MKYNMPILHVINAIKACQGDPSAEDLRGWLTTNTDLTADDVEDLETRSWMPVDAGMVGALMARKQLKKPVAAMKKAKKKAKKKD